MPIASGFRPLVRTLVRLRAVRIASLLFVLFNFVQVLRIQQRLSQYALKATEPSYLKSVEASANKQRVYISSIHWNNEPILHSYWNNALIALVEALGPENVFISVYESGSWDDSKNVLRDLDERLGWLGVNRDITLSETTHLDEISKPADGPGWIDTSRGKKELRRIPYLAKLRNLTLKNLVALSKQGLNFDKVLFLNDVVFTASSLAL
jgi:hypothetical protein